MKHADVFVLSCDDEDVEDTQNMGGMWEGFLWSYMGFFIRLDLVC